MDSKHYHGIKFDGAQKLSYLAVFSFLYCTFAPVMSSISLYELTTLVQQAIESTLPDMYWVEAELMEIRESKGHCYMELVQKDMFSVTPVARASAKCWRSQWQKVSERFLKATGGYPQTGMKLLLLASVDFHPAYGFSLIVDDIDPAYTLGDMARRRQEIIQQLKDEGVYDLQKELQLPLFCQRIAVISSATAAGYGDFSHQLLNNEYGLVFKPELFPAVMQGEMIESSIISQLNAINSRIDDFDCVVIIRGGGATSDMSGFDSLPLAENVANFPIPVITGIGHDRDECVLDLISYMKVKTPTAAAAFLVSSLAEVLARVEDAQATVVAYAALSIERQRNRLNRLSTDLSVSATQYKSREEMALERLGIRIVNALSQKISAESHRMDLYRQRIEALDPSVMLQRGYTMTLSCGRVVRDASALSSGQEIETVFANGRVKSVVK